MRFFYEKELYIYEECFIKREKMEEPLHSGKIHSAFIKELIVEVNLMDFCTSFISHVCVCALIKV